MYQTREEWMVSALPHLVKLLDEVHAPAFPNPLISVGIPSYANRMKKSEMRGECWPEKSTKSGRCSIFISPVLDDPVEVLGTLLHNLIHASVGVDAGHTHPFAIIAEKLGFSPPWKTAEVPDEGSALAHKLQGIIKKLGLFPHSPLQTSINPAHTKQKTKLRKYVCNKCGMIVRISAKVGMITCVKTFKKKGEKGYLPEMAPCGGIFACVDTENEEDAHPVRAVQLEEF